MYNIWFPGLRKKTFTNVANFATMFVTNKHNDVVINSKYETQSLRGEPLSSARLTPLTLAGNNKQATVPLHK